MLYSCWLAGWINVINSPSARRPLISLSFTGFALTASCLPGGGRLVMMVVPYLAIIIIIIRFLYLNSPSGIEQQLPSPVGHRPQHSIQR